MVDKNVSSGFVEVSVKISFFFNQQLHLGQMKLSIKIPHPVKIVEITHGK